MRVYRSLIDRESEGEDIFNEKYWVKCQKQTRSLQIPNKSCYRRVTSIDSKPS